MAIVIFEIGTQNFIWNKFLTNIANFGIESTFSKGSRFKIFLKVLLKVRARLTKYA